MIGIARTVDMAGISSRRRYSERNGDCPKLTLLPRQTLFYGWKVVGDKRIVSHDSRLTFEASVASTPKNPERDPPQNVTLIKHNLAQHKLTLLRDRSREAEVDREKFRRLMREIGLILCSEVTRNLRLKPSAFDAEPEGRVKYQGDVLEQHKIVIVPVIRGGLVLAEAFFELLPMAQGGHIGLFREYDSGKATVKVTDYFTSIPSSADTDFIILDSVIVTSTTVKVAVKVLLKLEIRPERIFVVSLVAHHKGLHRLYDDQDERFKKISVFTLAIDDGMDEQGFLVPGLGDVGVRLYGTSRS